LSQHCPLESPSVRAMHRKYVEHRGLPKKSRSCTKLDAFTGYSGVAGRSPGDGLDDRKRLAELMERLVEVVFSDFVVGRFGRRCFARTARL